MQRLKLFGGAAIESDAGPLTGRAVQRRRLALLAMLAAAGSARVSRDKLIAHLWPESTAENGRRFLSDSVYRINQALGGDVIVSAGDTLRLDEARLPSDLAELQGALSRNDFEGAVSAYTGPFLDGFFLSDSPEIDRWAEELRGRLARAYAGALDALAEAALARGNAAAAAGWWRKAAGHDPYNSRVALRLMQALELAGDRAAAIQHARLHDLLLAKDLEIAPDPTVRALAERLRTQSPEPAVATVESLHPLPAPTAHASSDAPADVSSAPPRPGRGPRYWRQAVVAGALSVLSIAAVGWWRGHSAGADEVAPRTVAVLPFANLSADRENEYFSDGITEELIAALGKTEGLRVVSRTSAFAYKNHPADVREVGRRLGVATVVEGSVRRSGTTLRITAQLVNTRDGYRLWSETYERELKDVFAIQEEIARSVAMRLMGALRGATDSSLARHATPDLEAYDLYLRGRYAWHQRTREGLATAVRYFEQAAAKSPGYARAHVGLGDAYAVSAFYDYLPPKEAYPRAESAARRALAIDAGLAAPHATLGYVLTYFHLDWSAAEAEFRRAIALDPSYSTAHQWFANLLTVAGRFTEAEAEMRLAQEADPLSLIAHAALGWSYFYAGRHEDALEQCRRTLAMNPRFELAHLWGGWALDAMGRRDEAREWIGRAVELSRGSTLTTLSAAHIDAAERGERRQRAREIVTAIAARAAAGEYVPSYEVAKVYLAMGDRARALDWLERAEVERSHSRAFLRVDPQLAPLRGDRRFEALLRRNGSR